MHAARCNDSGGRRAPSPPCHLRFGWPARAPRARRPSRTRAARVAPAACVTARRARARARHAPSRAHAPTRRTHRHTACRRAVQHLAMLTGTHHTCARSGVLTLPTTSRSAAQLPGQSAYGTPETLTHCISTHTASLHEGQRTWDWWSELRTRMHDTCARARARLHSAHAHGLRVYAPTHWLTGSGA